MELPWRVVVEVIDGAAFCRGVHRSELRVAHGRFRSLQRERVLTIRSVQNMSRAAAHRFLRTLAGHPRTNLVAANSCGWVGRRGAISPGSSVRPAVRDGAAGSAVTGITANCTAIRKPAEDHS